MGIIKNMESARKKRQWSFHPMSDKSRKANVPCLT